MTSPSFTLFDTPIGRCAIAWSAHGITALQLPEATDATTRARLLKRHPEAREAPPPPDIAHAIAAIIALTHGEPRDLSAIVLDMTDIPKFNRRVYAVARAIGPGATLTYGEVAARLGEEGAARAVGQALGANPFAIIVPCHRVVAAADKAGAFKPGGFSAHGGAATKRRLLAIEGAASEAPTLFDRDGGLEFALRPRGAQRAHKAGRRGPG